MNSKDRILFWILGFIVVGLFLSTVSEILLPFVVALIFAYFLDPAADKIEDLGASRTVATLLITATFFIVVIILAILMVPLLYDQFVAMTNKIPEYIKLANDTLLPSITILLERLDPDAVANAKKSLSEVSVYIFEFLAQLAGNIWNSGIAIVNILSLIFITPIVTFYMLRDWDRIVEKVNGWLPPKHAKTIRTQAKEIDRTLAGYIRGQTNVCILLGTFYAIGLTAAGLDFGLFIGMATGILSFIPYVGLLVGFVFGMVIAFFQFADLTDVLIIAAIFIVGQILEGNFVAPKLVGDKVGLHPVWIIFGMLAGASIFGFTGILLAIPVTAIIGVLTRFSLNQYLKSPLYKEVESSRKAGA